jgi:signal transduction histidine kinase
MNIGASGLPSALRELCTRMTGDVTCRCHSPRFLRIDHNVAVNLYRIAQEAVANSLKHANASEITVSLERTDDGIVLTVSDDGHAKRGRRGGGLGTLIMKYRAHAIGAILKIKSTKTRGTTVTCRVPRKR